MEDQHGRELGAAVLKAAWCSHLGDLKQVTLHSWVSISPSGKLGNSSESEVTGG